MSTADFIKLNDNEVRFVADAHFRSRAVAGEPERRERFIRFLELLPGDSSLFLLGDIFDFYFEYRSVVPKRFVDLFNAFIACRRRGVSLHFLGGNHDYWVGDFIANELGMTIHRNEILLLCQGRKIVCAHGDLIMPRDAGYKVLKTILRNRLVIGASKWIHPDLMDAIARGVATGSRRISKANQEKRAHQMANLAHQKFFERGNDVFVMGHVHFPVHDVRNGREFLLVGDWIHNFTYGKLVQGRLSLDRFTDTASG
jgi:UDP-2,3-diacylglucosamine hydrolase